MVYTLSSYSLACLVNLVFSQLRSEVGWKKLWQIEVPPKVMSFIWRLCWDFLPTKVQLTYRHIQVPITCVFCQQDVEHIWHIFLVCPFAQECW